MGYQLHEIIFSKWGGKQQQKRVRLLWSQNPEGRSSETEAPVGGALTDRQARHP